MVESFEKSKSQDGNFSKETQNGNDEDDIVADQHKQTEK